MEQYRENGPDILVRSPDNDIALIAEVKVRTQSSQEWAAKFRSNLFLNHVIPKSRFFLLALPDFLYLWRNSNGPEPIRPDYAVRTVNVLQNYLTRSKTEPKYIGEEGLQLALTSWLRDATFSNKRPAVGSDSHTLLVESGLLDAIGAAEVSSHYRV